MSDSWKEYEERKAACRAHFDAERKRINLIFSCIAIAYLLAFFSWPFVMRYVFSP